MNTMMYNHPLTAVHLRLLQDLLGYTVIPPIEKLLACGDRGVGAMAESKDIAAIVARIMTEHGATPKETRHTSELQSTTIESKQVN
jgi:phosphopantothenoylcysteine synthetase/decarboxylase